MSTELPWDRFTPTEEPDNVLYPHPPAPPVPVPIPVPVPGPPPTRPPAQPGTPPTAEVKALAKDLLDEAFNYAKASISAIMAGQTVDLTHPTVTAETATGRELVVADAKSRSWRTLIQGLIFDVFAALVAVVATLSGADPFVKETWVAFGVLLLKSVMSAVISYFMRLKVTPTMKTEGTTLAIMPVPRPMPNKEE